MSWLGSLFNAAKVGVGLLNGIMNPTSGSNVDYETALLKGNPGHLIRVSLPGKDKERVFRILAVHIVVSNDKEKVGKTFNLYAGGNVDDGDVAFAVTEAPGGGNILTAVNNSTERDYYINFGQTNAKALLSTQNMVLGRVGGKYPNLVDCTSAFNHYSLGNLVVTPVQVQADTDAFLSAMAPSVGIPFSTILGNIGFASVIADTLFFIYNSAVGNIQIKWNTDGSGITSYIVMNRTNFKITVSVNVNWSNPAIGATVNVTVPPKGDSEGKLPDNDSPISSASVCAFTESTNYSAVLKAGFQQMESDNVKMYVARFSKKSKPTPCDDGADSGLSKKDLQLLKAIKALGNDEAILKLGNGNGKKKDDEWD